jgi:hypothetical protein
VRCQQLDSNEKLKDKFVTGCACKSPIPEKQKPHHHRCPQPFFNSLQHLLTCYTLIMPSPVTSINCQWISAGQASFTHTSKITRVASQDQASSAIRAHQLILRKGCDSLCHSCIACCKLSLIWVLPATKKYDTWLTQKLQARVPYLLNILCT